MIPVLVVRAEPACTATVRAARAKGLDAHGYPMFDVRPLGWEPPPADSFDALLIGSANALRHGGPGLAAYRGKPAYAVGKATAEAARAAGFEVVATGEGGLQDLLSRLAPGHRRLLRLAGRARVDLTLAAGLAMAERVVYASEPLPMPPKLAARLEAGGLVLLHSREAGVHFAAECQRCGIDRAALRIAAIGPRVAAAMGPGWAQLASAPSPNDEALLALAGQMCQNPEGATE